MATKKRGAGEGTIFQRQDGRWTAVISLGYYNGKRRRKTIYGETFKEVKDQLQRLQVEAQKGMLINTERQTVGQFLDSWLQNVKNTVRPASYINYEQTVRLHIKPYIGQVTLEKLSPQNLQVFISESTKAGKTPTLIRYNRTVLRIALGQALKWGLVSRNVASLVEPPKAERKREIKFLTPDQAKHFFDNCDEAKDRHTALYALTLALGLRLGEVTGLHWKDVDLTAGTIKICGALQRIYGEGLKIVETKSAQSNRTLSLPTQILNRLKDHRIRQLQYRLAAGDKWQDTDLVFTTLIGTPVDSKALLKSFQSSLHRAGLPKMRFHDLRHSCATILLAIGVAPRTVMEILGHSQIGLTMDTYSHIVPELKQEVADLMDQVLQGKAKVGRNS